MASKTSMLKQGAKTTGKGLFAGMSRLDSREDAPREEKGVTSVIEEKKTETKLVNDIASESVTQLPENIVLEESEKLEQNQLEDIPSEHIKEKSNEEMNEPVIENDTSLPDEQAVKPAEEPVKESVKVIEQVATPVSAQENDQSKDINPSINIAQKADPTVGKTTSRYEKEKFLLLDIRGYRDYVEHMAKAANMSATKYIRKLIQQDMDKNNDIYLAHKALEEKLRGRSGD